MNKINTLVAWAKEHGAQISPEITFEQISKDNFGACTHGSAEKVAITVPPQITMRLSTAAESFRISEDEAKKMLNINGILKMYLARERSLSNSFYAPYIDTLPSSAQINSPYVWSAHDKSLLQGTNLGNSLRENIQSLVAEWWSVLEALPKETELPANHHVNMKFYYESKFYDDDQLHTYLLAENNANWASFAAYLWASMVVKSRAFPSALLPSEHHIDTCQEDVVILLPVIDLLNHDPRADVTWHGSEDGFRITCVAGAGQLYNNYGRKGNEELLLAYGFCLADNSADTVALRIKIPSQILPYIQEKVQLPKMADYTSSVVPGTGAGEAKNDDGVLFFVGLAHVPENLVQLFSWLVKNPWDGETLNLRMQLSGLNHLRQAMESKMSMVQSDVSEASPENAHNIKTYLAGQRKVLQSAVSWVKHREAELLAAHKAQVLTLKAVYKKDTPFAQSLLVTMGIASYADILEQDQTDQVWLLYLIRCFNSQEYSDGFLPAWVGASFRRMDAETDLAAADVVRFQPIYENLILPMNKAVPEIYNRGKWTVRELIVSSRLMDTIGFVRGKHQECILVNPDATSDN